MEYRRLGKSGLKVSALSYGSWVTFSNQIDVNNAVTMMAQAYDAGVNFFDNAEVYADGDSERVMGKALKELGWSRDSYCVSSKVFWGGNLPTQRGLNRKHVTEACNAALKRLQVDYLDLYFCHRPDQSTPIEETVRAMDTLITQGKILYWGTSEWSAREISEAYGIAAAMNLTPPTMEQPQYNMFTREKIEAEFGPLFSGNGLGTTIFSPLASGFLTGKYNTEIPSDSRLTRNDMDWLRNNLASPEGQEKIAKIKKLMEISNGLDISIAQMSIAWCLKNSNVSTVILGASRSEQLTENLKAIDVVKLLTPDIMEKIEEILKNKPVQPTQF